MSRRVVRDTEMHAMLRGWYGTLTGIGVMLDTGDDNPTPDVEYALARIVEMQREMDRVHIDSSAITPVLEIDD